MSATSNPNTPAPNAAPTPTPPYTPSPTDYTYTWGQISAGPQAIAFKAVMQLATLLTQIMDMYNQQANTQLTVQSQSALAASQATMSAAKDQAYQTVCEATNSFAGAAVAAGGMVHTSLATDTKPYEAADKDKNALSDLQATFSKVKVASPSDGAAGPTAVKPPRDAEVEKRIQLLTAGGMNKENSLLSVAHASKSDPEVKAKTEAAIAQMSDKERDQFSQKLTSAQDTNSKEINNCVTAKQTLQSEITMHTNLANGLFSTTSQAVSASFQAKAGQEQAASALANNNAQQAGSMASTSQGLISKFYDEELQGYQMLQQVAASASVRG